MNDLLHLDDLPADLTGRAVFVRVDFNVPLAEGEVLDSSRIEAAIPTLQQLVSRGAVVLCASHCGRPKGMVNPQWSLRPVVPVLASLLERPVAWVSECVGEPVTRAVADAQPGDLLLLENLRFHAGESTSDNQFAEALAANADVFVGEAFGTAHRDHASVTGVAKRVADKAAGYLMHSEVTALTSVLTAPRKPLVLIMGGAKMSGKIETLKNLLPLADRVLLGGGIANTFIAAQGHSLGNSLVESERIETAHQILEQAASRGVEIVLPSDFVVTTDLGNASGVREREIDAIAEDEAAVDIGSDSLVRYRQALEGAGTVLWNGPLGVFEKPPFDRGTMEIAKAMQGSTAQRIVGGGETVSAVKKAGVAADLDHVSTGGGAMLELLAGKALPGVEILRKPEGN